MKRVMIGLAIFAAASQVDARPPRNEHSHDSRWERVNQRYINQRQAANPQTTQEANPQTVHGEILPQICDACRTFYDCALSRDISKLPDDMVQELITDDTKQIMMKFSSSESEKRRVEAATKAMRTISLNPNLSIRVLKAAFDFIQNSGGQQSRIHIAKVAYVADIPEEAVAMIRRFGEEPLGNEAMWIMQTVLPAASNKALQDEVFLQFMTHMYVE